MKENIESKYVGNRKMIIELRLKAKPIPGSGGQVP